MLFGKFASNRNEARFPSLWDGLVGAWCPSVQGPSGLRLWDLSGRANNGTLTNMDAPTDWLRSGAGGYALDFTTAGRDNVNFGNVCYIPNDLTISFSVYKMASSSNFSNFWAVNRWNTGGSPGTNEYSTGLASNVSGSGNNPCFAIEIGTTTHSINSTISLSLNTWTNVVCIRSGATLQIFVGGSLGGTTSSVPTTAITNRSRNLRLADSDISTDLGNSQQLDDIRIYNRALSASEIRTLASQRGIAYQPRKRRLFGSIASSFRRRYQNSQATIGVGVV